MSTGLDFDERYSALRLHDPSIMLFGSTSHAAYSAFKPLLYKPGTHWSYSSGTSNLLARHLRHTFGDAASPAADAAYRNFAHRELFAPLGMRSAVLEADASGTYVASSFAFATARDWARFGLMYLNGGRAFDDAATPVLAEGWAAHTRTARARA